MNILWSFANLRHLLKVRRYRLEYESIFEVKLPFCVISGHLLFEMAAGYELDAAYPQQRHLASIEQQEVKDVRFWYFYKYIKEHFAAMYKFAMW